MKTLDLNHICFELFAVGKVTPKGFSDVSILSGGEAQGHGCMVDERTIEQFIGATMGKTLPAYLTHEDAMEDRLGDEIGMFSGFYRDGMKVRAKNFNFLQAFIDNEPDEYATLVELAQKYPDQLGISPVIRMAQVWCMPDGTEIPADGMDSKPEMATNQLPALRIVSVKSCDFVQQPAANVGLFEAKVDGKPINETNLMATQPDTILLSKHTEEVISLQTQHKDAIAALETKHKDAVTALEKKVNDAVAALAVAQEDTKKLTAALAAKASEAEEAAKYDMRKAGAPALQIALESHTVKVPAPGKNDAENWATYHALLSANNTDQAAAFKAKYLTRK